MFDRGLGRQLQASANAAFGAGQTGRADAEDAIRMLGTKAHKQVPTATALHFGQWLGWPDWLREGTSITDPGPLPPTVTLADDLIIVGNIIDNADYLALVERMLTSPRPVMGTTGALSLMHAPDLGLALSSLVRAMAAQNPFVLIRFEERGDEAEIALMPPWPMGPLFRFSAMAGCALIYRAIETLHCNDLAAMTLETQLHSAPEAQRLLAGFACRVAPTAGAERLRFPRAWLATANPHHDPMLWAVARTKLAALESEAGEPEDVAAVRAFIIHMLLYEQRVPRLKQVAAHLGLSSRTIVRLLARHDTSFHALVEQERKARALLVIADQSVSLAEAARALGFSDMSSFGRSFRKWFGETPGNMRKAWGTRAAIAPGHAARQSA
jgi:AraC-like DNA-binding protein